MNTLRKLPDEMFDVDEFDAELLRAGVETIKIRRKAWWKNQSRAAQWNCLDKTLCEAGKDRAVRGYDGPSDWHEVISCILGDNHPSLPRYVHSQNNVGIGQQLAAEFMGLL